MDGRNNPAHCGACGASCSAGQCRGGECTAGRCERLTDDCNEWYADGCETNLGYDRTYCGACGTRCGAGETCEEGLCTR